MRNEKILKEFGLTFRIRAMPAVMAKEQLDATDEERSVTGSADVLDDGVWISLENDDLINQYLPRWEALVWLDQQIMNYNFGFLGDWRPMRLPGSMVAGYNAVATRHVDGLFSSLVSGGMASYKELCEDYSLEDAFKLLEILTVEKINEHLANESAK